MRPTLRPRRRARPFSAFLAALCIAAALAPTPSPAQSQPRLPVVELQAGIHVIRSEIASDHESRMRGLMFRERLGRNEGMLFVFDAKSIQCFWMRNTFIPLTIAFIDDDGGIVNLADMQPKSEDSHCSAKPIRFALEMEQGWFAKRGLKAGDRLQGPRGLFGAAR